MVTRPKSLVCSKCGSEYGPGTLAGCCSRCGYPLTIVYDYDELREEEALFDGEAVGVWRYAKLLPCSGDRVVTLGEGGTTLVRCSKLGERLGLKNLYVKDETKNPTGSFLDRGSSVLVTRLLESGFRGVYGVFKGNLGASLSAYSARAGLRCVAFISGRVEASKLYQMIAYGAVVHSLDRLEEARFGEGYYFVDNADPLLVEGEKTVGFEILEEMGFQQPDFIVVPVGSGGLITAVWKSLRELQRVGLLDHVDCRLVGVQAERCSPIVDMFYSSGGGQPRRGETVALDIAFEKPSRGLEAVKALRESRGYAFRVSDEEMLAASIELARSEGIFAEPAAASTLACVRRMLEEGVADPSDTIVCVVTGSGLKDPLAAVRELERNIALERFIERKAGFGARLGLGGTKIRILRILSRGSLHGYDVWRRLREGGRGVSIPAVYQHLRELERMKLIAVDRTEVVKGKLRIYYRVTRRGLELLDALS